MKIKLSFLNQFGLQVALVTAFTGTLGLAFDLGPFHMFPYRIMVFIMWFLVFIKTGTIDIGRVRMTLSFQFLLIWLIYGVLSLLWAMDKAGALKHIVFMTLNFSMIFFIVFLTDTFSSFKRLYNIWMMIFVVLIPIAFWEVLTGNHLSVSGLNNVSEGYEFYKFAPTTLFGNQNDYATFIAMSLPMFMVGVRYSQKTSSKLLMGIIYGCGIVILIFSTSRSNYIGVILGLMFWFLFMQDVKTKFKLIFTFVVVLFIVSFYLSSRNMEYLTGVWQDFEALLNVQNGGDSGLNSRQNLVRNAIYFAVKSGGFGVGAGNVEYYMANSPKFYVGAYTNVHNWWAELLANYGIIIFLMYVFFYFGLGRSLWKLYLNLSDRNEKMICEALLCGLITFSVSSLSPSSVMSFRPQWIFFGLVIAFININKNKKLDSTRINAHTNHSF
ncbi:O-antigen ligase family protein [uncultured Roseivirga sp.]|uniref:O-antigen ligase family protein n=1 Tax=uncultured Roseivirga sp. TaxID=543088 RepID=UPI0030DDBFD5